MNYDKAMAIVNEVGANRVLAVYFDNNRAIFYPEGDFNPSDMMDSGDDEIILKEHTKILSAPGTLGGKLDIPVTIYNYGVQAIVTLDNEKDLPRVDRHSLYVR